MSDRKNWGVPDWRDANAYPRPDDLTLNQWHWEFLRRGEDYRKDWLLHFDENLPKHMGLPIPDWETRKIAKMPGCREKYGIKYLLDPSVTQVGIHLFLPRYGGVITYASREIFEEYDRNGLKLFIFDLKNPLEPQFRHAKLQLNRLQKHLFGDVSKRKLNKKWPLYLRVIDARDSGETLETIGREILRKEDYDEAIKRAGETLQAAKHLQKNFPSQPIPI